MCVSLCVQLVPALHVHSEGSAAPSSFGLSGLRAEAILHTLYDHHTHHTHQPPAITHHTHTHTPSLKRPRWSQGSPGVHVVRQHRGEGLHRDALLGVDPLVHLHVLHHGWTYRGSFCELTPPMYRPIAGMRDFVVSLNDTSLTSPNQCIA